MSGRHRRWKERREISGRLRLFIFERIEGCTPYTASMPTSSPCPSHSLPQRHALGVHSGWRAANRGGSRPRAAQCQPQRAHRRAPDAHQEPLVSFQLYGGFGCCPGGLLAVLLACRRSVASCALAPPNRPSLTKWSASRHASPASSLPLLMCRELLVQWTTRDAGQPVARYGSSPDALALTVPATTTSYGSQDMCGPPASTFGFVDPGMLHTATLSGLLPGQQYWYQVGDPVRANWLQCAAVALLLRCCWVPAGPEGSPPLKPDRPSSFAAGRRRLERLVFVPHATPAWRRQHCAHLGSGGPGRGRGALCLSGRHVQGKCSQGVSLAANEARASDRRCRTEAAACQW